METNFKHWTSESTDAFVHRISSDFVLQLENKMNGAVNQNDLAKRLGVSKGRVSQIFNDPGNLTLKKMVEYSRILGLKVAVVAYDDGDPTNQNGPINSEIFNVCWKRAGTPKTFFALNEPAYVVRTVTPFCFVIAYYHNLSQSALTPPDWSYGNNWQPLNMAVTTTDTAALTGQSR